MFAVSITGIPKGVIVCWKGSIATIPSGWLLCNGSNGTPDLRDRFIVAAREDEGGIAKTNLVGGLTVSGGSIAHNHGFPDAGFTSNGEYAITGIDPASQAPPYYALAYIMKV